MTASAAIKVHKSLKLMPNHNIGDTLLVLLLGWPAMVVVLSGIGFWLGVAVTPFHLWTALSLAVLGAIVVASSLRHCIYAVVIFVLIVLLGSYSIGQIYDLSFDGQVYHIPAVIALADGWNPIHAQTLGQWSPEFERSLGSAIYVQHYAKGAWIFSAAVYESLGFIELGKTLNILLLSSAFLAAYGFLVRHGFSRIWATAMAAAFSLNPVSIYQATTFYVDGALASVFTVILFLSLDYIRKPGWRGMLLLACATLLIVEIKFTGLVYGALLIFGMAVIAWITRGRRTAMVYAGYLATVGILGVLVIGYQPYVTNTLNYGHPFYPALGKEQDRNVIWSQAPDEFISKNRFEKVVQSTFAKSENSLIEWKVPFMVYESELDVLSGSDIRYAGFGPLFSGILILSLIACLVSLRRVPAPIVKLSLAITGILLVTIMVNPEAWWARLSPQLWLLPTILAAVAMFSAIEWHKKLATLVFLLAVGSSGLVCTINYSYALDRSNILSGLLSHLKNESRTTPVQLSLAEGFKVTTEMRLKSRGIRYIVYESSTCEPQHRLKHILKYCR